MNYLGKFWPSTTEVSEPMQKLTLMKCDWNSMYQNLHDRAKTSLKRMQPWHYTMKKSSYT